MVTVNWCDRTVYQVCKNVYAGSDWCPNDKAIIPFPRMVYAIGVPSLMALNLEMLMVDSQCSMMKVEKEYPNCPQC